MGLERVAVVARARASPTPAFPVITVGRHQRQGLDRGASDGAASVRSAAPHRHVHLAAPRPLQRAHPRRRGRGRRCGADCGVRAHRGGARRHDRSLFRNQHAGGAADLRAAARRTWRSSRWDSAGRLDATNLVDAGCRRARLRGPRSSRLARRHARAHRRGEGRHLPRRQAGRCSARRACPRACSTRSAALACARAVVAERGLQLAASSAAGWDYDGLGVSLTACRPPRSPVPSSTATPPPRIAALRGAATVPTRAGRSA